MVNHARTLLLNVARAPAQDAIGEEIIDAAYVPRRLPFALAQARRVLFGDRPDRCMLNYRGRQLLTLLHSSELAEFVTDLDSRLTYDLQADPFFDPALYVSTVSAETTGNSAVAEVWLQGTAGSGSSQLRREWSVIVEDDEAEVTLVQPLSVATTALTYSSGVSNLVPLQGSSLSFLLGPYGSPAPGDGPRFRVHSLVRPAEDLGQLQLLMEHQGDEVLAGLFGIGSPLVASEPFKTFYNLFRYHDALPYRLGGAVLALIYQTDRLQKT